MAAVTRVVRDADMTEQVMFTSFSPALLLIASHRAPEITRILSLNGPPVPDRRGDPGMCPDLDVTLIDKQRNLGLQWAEIDVIFRLPGYRSVAEVLSTAAAIGVRIIEADFRFLESAGAPFVDTLHALGLKVIGFTATSPEEWLFLESVGLDGIYTDDVPFGVAHQAPIP